MAVISQLQTFQIGGAAAPAFAAPTKIALRLEPPFLITIVRSVTIIFNVARIKVTIIITMFIV